MIGIGKLIENMVSGGFLTVAGLGALACCGLLFVPFIVGPAILAFVSDSWPALLSATGVFAVGGIVAISYWRHHCACELEAKANEKAKAAELAPRHGARFARHARARMR